MSKWNPPRWLTASRAAFAYAFVVALVACILPLTRVLGPESALLLALTMSPLAGAIGARFARKGAGVDTGSLLAKSIGWSWLSLCVPIALLALNGLRVNPCDPIAGLRFIALGPAMAVALSALLGALFGSSLPWPPLAMGLAIAAPLLDAAHAVVGFLRSPAVFAYGHFFGYFPGTFYDRKVEVPDAWLSHRLQTVLIAAGLWALLVALRDPESGRLRSARLSERPIALGFACVLALGCTWIARAGHALHHVSSGNNIAAQLGSIIETKKCRAVLPRELPVGQAARLAEDCEFRIGQLEKLLGVKEDERITAYFFRSPEEKRDLMGAARVYIAKPWRREVYLQLADYPHPVLAHELAHVVARHASDGLLGMPGALGGLIPEPTLVEGMAVALEPVSRDELTTHQWAKAARAEQLAPSLSSLMGLGFYGANQTLAYTMAGSFLRFVLDTRGAAALKDVYRQGDAARALKKSLPELQHEWSTYLEQVPLPPRAPALARLRFERPGVWSQVCPHLIEQLDGELNAALGAGDLERAQQKCQAVLKVDENDSDARVTLAGLLAQRGQLEEADAEVSKLRAESKRPTPAVTRAETAIADAQFARQEYARAEAAYRALLDQPQPEAEARQLEVKLLALAAGEPTRSLLREYFVSEPFGRHDTRTAMHLIGQLTQVRTDGLAAYLEARQLKQAERYDLVQSLVREGLSRGLPTPRLRVEALRMQVQAGYVVGALSEAEAVASQLQTREGASLAEQLEAKDWKERIGFRRAGVH